MIKRLTFFFLTMLFLPCALHAAGVSIDSFTAVPNEIYAHKQVPVVLSAHITHLKTVLPTNVVLKRLQADGNFSKIMEMRDDGLRGDKVANDSFYTSVLKLKEPIAGLLCYIVEVSFPNNVSPLRSKPLFIKVMGKPWGSE